MDLRDIFAFNLRRLRNARELSQDTLAYDADVSRSYLSQLEKGAAGKFYASLRVVEKFASTLEVDAGEFFRLPLKKPRRKTAV